MEMENNISILKPRKGSIVINDGESDLLQLLELLADKTEKRQMTVEGKAELRVLADCVEVMIEVKHTEKASYLALRKTQESVVRICKLLLSCGLRLEDIQTSDTQVNKMDSWAQSKSRTPETKYVCTCSILCTFKYDLDLLAKVEDRMSKEKLDYIMRVEFKLRDPRIYIQRALEDACADARKCAERMAAGCGAQLGKLQSVDYDCRGRIDYPTPVAQASRYPSFLKRAARKEREEEITNFNEEKWSYISPTEIQISQTVNTVWEIL
jgi:uncharacterized protein YggE